jgi:hypothetical protein
MDGCEHGGIINAETGDETAAANGQNDPADTYAPYMRAFSPPLTLDRG